MLFNILVGVLIFGYAAWTIVRYVQKSKQGKCASCSVQKSCQVGCSVITDIKE